MYANEIPPDRSKCISQLILEICQCLPWQYNSQVERLTCNDQETVNCSVSVRNLWKSVGGNCETAVKVTKQMFRISYGYNQNQGDDDLVDNISTAPAISKLVQLEDKGNDTEKSKDADTKKSESYDEAISRYGE